MTIPDAIIQLYDAHTYGGALEMNLERFYEAIKDYEELSKSTDEEVERNFEIFWDEYPRKTDKKKAKHTFVKMKLGRKKHLFDEVMQGLRKQLQAGILKQADIYTPHPSTWLHRERWKDEIVNWNKRDGAFNLETMKLDD